MAGRVNQLFVLRAQRKVNKLPFTQREVATSAGISPTRYNQIENDQPPAPTDVEVMKLAKAFGVPESRLGLKPRKAAEKRVA